MAYTQDKPIKPGLICVIRLVDFDPIKWPVISCPRHAKHEHKHRSEELAETLQANPNSCVVILGTSSSEPQKKRKVLGLAYLKSEIIRTETVLHKDTARPYIGDHGFKYPWGVKIDSAVNFQPPRTDSKDIFGADYLLSVPRNKYKWLYSENVDDAAIIDRIWKLPMSPRYSIT